MKKILIILSIIIVGYIFLYFYLGGFLTGFSRGKIIIYHFSCADICPQYGHWQTQYYNVKSEQECLNIGGEPILITYAGVVEHSYDGCRPVKDKGHNPLGDKCQIDSDCICTLTCPDCCGKTGQTWKCVNDKCELGSYEEVTDWIKDLIEKEENEPIANPPASLTKCEYKNQIVYYLPPRCCDISSILYDENGNFICAPDGGFTGSGTENAQIFLKREPIVKLFGKIIVKTKPLI